MGAYSPVAALTLQVGDLVDDDHLSFQRNKQSDWNLVATARFLYLLRILSSQDP